MEELIGYKKGESNYNFALNEAQMSWQTLPLDSAYRLAHYPNAFSLLLLKSVLMTALQAATVLVAMVSGKNNGN